MRRATSFQPLAGISAGLDAPRPRSASEADDLPDGRASPSRFDLARPRVSDRVTPTTLSTPAAAIAHRGVRRAPPVATPPIGHQLLGFSVRKLFFRDPALAGNSQSCDDCEPGGSEKEVVTSVGVTQR